MATKFIQLDDAAELLGISVEQLVEMRARNEIRGFRDGTTWKFKSDDIQQLGQTLQSSGSTTPEASPAEPAESAGGSDLQLAPEDEQDVTSESKVPLAQEAEGGEESVLLSERELGGSDVTGKSTIIDDSSEEVPEKSDIQLADAEAGTSDVQLVGDSMIKGSDSGLEGSDIGLADSDLDLSADDQAAQTMKAPSEPAEDKDSGSDLSLQFEDLSALDLDSAVESDSGPELDAGSGLSLEDSGLSLDKGSELSLDAADSGPLAEGSSALNLSEEHDDELVLGEGSGSDITAGAGDSGISLGDLADSGLSLEEAPADLDLGGSSVDESLVLGPDDMITLGDDLASASAETRMKSDEDFLLTPLGEDDEELSESGSQVIPLDQAAAGYDASGATMLHVSDEEGLLIEDDAATMIGGPEAAEDLGLGPATVVKPGTAVEVVPIPAVPEAPYSIWNVLSLFCCTAVLCLTGMLVYDVVRQMWSWQGSYPVNSALMDSIIGLFPSK